MRNFIGEVLTISSKALFILHFFLHIFFEKNRSMQEERGKRIHKVTFRMLPFPSGEIIPGSGGMEESAFLECREEIQLTPTIWSLPLSRAVNRGFSSVENKAFQ